MMTFFAEIVATFGTLWQVLFSNNATEREAFYSIFLICIKSTFPEIYKVDNVGIFVQPTSNGNKWEVVTNGINSTNQFYY